MRSSSRMLMIRGMHNPVDLTAVLAGIPLRTYKLLVPWTAQAGRSDCRTKLSCGCEGRAGEGGGGAQKSTSGSQAPVLYIYNIY